MADSAVKIPFIEAAAPSTPAANRVVIYCKSDGLMYSKDDAGVETLMSAGSGGIPATIFDAAGDLIVASGADTAARLAIGATNGMVLMRVGGAVAWALPSGHEFDYVALTSAVTITATAEASATTIVTANAVTFDGSTVVLIEGMFPVGQFNGTVNDLGTVTLYDGSSSIGRFPAVDAEVTGVTNDHSVYIATRLTPSAAAHTYSWRGYKNANTFVIGGGAGGSGNNLPAFIRITKA